LQALEQNYDNDPNNFKCILGYDVEWEPAFEISHVKGYSGSDGLEIMVNMLEIGNNTPNENMLMANGFQKTTYERAGVWYTKTISNDDLDKETGVDGEGSPTLTLSYTLRLGTKDAGQVDDEIVYKAMTAREIAFSAIILMAPQTVTSEFDVQEDNDARSLTRSLHVTPPVTLTIDGGAEVAMGMNVYFDIKLVEFDDMFKIRARKCSVQCKSEHCQGKEVCIYGCDGQTPFCHQPFAEFVVDPIFDGTMTYAHYSYTAFKWETVEESDVDEQVVVCEVELSTEDMAYQTADEDERDCQ